MKKKTYFTALSVGSLILASAFIVTKPSTPADTLHIAERHLANMCTASNDRNMYPRSVKEDGSVAYVSSSDWTSGYFPGSLWYMFEYTHDKKWAEQAEKWTAGLTKEQYNRRTHDVGLMLYCSFGNGYRLTGNEAYKNILLNGARSLLSRFNSKTGCIRSWDFGKDRWQFPVIIDNMMNLELLFWATRISGDSSYYRAAKSHALQTLKNHFRKDHSSFHVVDYDTLTGQPRRKQTFQGIADSSAWARGQAWGIYGFTVAYRETHDPRFLEQAMAGADYFLHHKNLPEDKIPYWDFNDPRIPDAPKDASAAAITASALLELARYTSSQKEKYNSAALLILKNLSSPDYLAAVNSNNNFILMHSTGNHPAGSEINEPINYADYYFIEALIRSLTITQNK